MTEGGAPEWCVRSRTVALARPLVLGILNVTPDSFSDGGAFSSPAIAADHAARLLDEGADAIDVGGESTRPQGAVPVPVDEELRRVRPVVERLRARFPTALLSVDTVKSAVARVALDCGADIVNDVSAFRLDPEMAAVCAGAGAGVLLMHSRGTVSEMATYRHADYGADPVGEIVSELAGRVVVARSAGIAPAAIAVDPGIGFAKRPSISLAVLGALERVGELGYPVAVGVSRKRFLGELTGEPEPAHRVIGTVAANVMAFCGGARIFRVHDARATRQALDVARAIREARAAG